MFKRPGPPMIEQLIQRADANVAAWECKNADGTVDTKSVLHATHFLYDLQKQNRAGTLELTGQQLQYLCDLAGVSINLFNEDIIRSDMSAKVFERHRRLVTKLHPELLNDPTTPEYNFFSTADRFKLRREYFVGKQRLYGDVYGLSLGQLFWLRSMVLPDYTPNKKNKPTRPRRKRAPILSYT
jgi:hypothetical protein